MNTNKDIKEKHILAQIDSKLDVLILLIALQGKTDEEKVKILKKIDSPLSKREIQKITGIDRHKF